MLDKGYVYFLFSTHSWLFKIGKAKDLGKRVDNISKSIPGKILVIWSAVLIKKDFYEKRLHERYKKNRVTWLGSGRTEWFRLNPLQAIWVIFDLIAYQFGQILAFFLIILFFLLIISN